MTTIKNTIPAIATHPGTILKDEIEANDFSQIDFAKMIGYSRSQLNEIIKGKRNISADLALLLEKTLGIDADYWMEAQKNYDLDKARIQQKNKELLESIEIWNATKSLIPVAFFKKEKIITGNPIQDNQIIRSLYGILNLDNLAVLSVQNTFARFKKSTQLKSDVVNIIGWVKLVQYKAAAITAPPFNQENQEQLINELKLILSKNKNVLDKVKSKLHDFGIKLIYQAKGEKTPIDGISFWSEGNPAIGMTIRHSRLDNFAFTLFHELGHIYEHLINSDTAEFIDLETKSEIEEYKNSIEEMQANEFAENKLIPKEDWAIFSANLSAKNNDRDIVAFAKKINVHPAIVKGRICHSLKSYRSITAIDNNIG